MKQRTLSEMWLFASSGSDLMSAGRFVALALVGLMAAGAVVILSFRIFLPSPKRMMSETCRVTLWLSALGVCSFLAGLGLIIYDGQYATVGAAFLVGGFVAVCASIGINAMTAKAKRAQWPVVPARCMERNLRKVHTSADAKETWLWTLVCEVTHAGRSYRVTPRVRWSDLAQADAAFWTEEEAKQFLDRRISPAGECKLRINPNDPLEAELVH